MFRRQRSVEQQPVHADDAVQRRANFVRDHGEEARFGTACRIGMVTRFAECALGLGAIGDVASDALNLSGFIRIGAYQTFTPADPTWAACGCDLLVVDTRARRVGHDLALLQDRKLEASADENFARFLCQRAIGVVDRSDGAVRLS